MTAIVAFKLASPLSGALPHVLGIPLPKGLVPLGQYLSVDAAGASVTVRRRWNDGSVKKVRVAGTFTLAAGVQKQFNISASSTPVSGTAMTTADLVAKFAGRTDTSAAFAGLGTVALHTLLASPPSRTEIADANHIENQYQAYVGSSRLWVRFYVVATKNSPNVRVRVKWGNGNTQNTSDSAGQHPTVDAIPTITVGGAVKFDNGGVAFHHDPIASHTVVGWVDTDPQIVTQHDAGALLMTRLFPNYNWKRGQVPQATIDAWGAATKQVNNSGDGEMIADLNYIPGRNCCITPVMGAPGFQDGIGMLPTWDALLLTSNCHPTFYKLGDANACAFNSFGVNWVDATTLDPIQISDFPTRSVSLDGSGGNEIITFNQARTVQYHFETAHAPLVGYVQYALTDDSYYLETMANNAVSCYMALAGAAGSGLNRMPNGQVRGRAWTDKVIGSVAAHYPDSLASTYQQFETWLTNIINVYQPAYADLASNTSTFTAAAAWLGMEDDYGNYDLDGYDANGNMVVQLPLWQHHFRSQVTSFLIEIEALTDAHKAPLISHRDWLLKSAVWPFGGNGPNEYNASYAGSYIHSFRSDVVYAGPYTGPSAHHFVPTNPGMVWLDTVGTTNTTNNSLQGISGSAPDSPSGYIANALPSLAAAVDHGAFITVGGVTYTAAQAFARLTSMDNWNEQSVNAGYESLPTWAVMPYSFSMPTANFTPVDSGAIVTTPGPSIRVDPLPLHTAGFFVTKQPGIGIPLPQIVGGGSDGTSPIYDAVQSAGGTVSSLSEIRLVAAAGTHGTYSPDETGGGVYNGDGASDTVNVDYYLDGAQINSAPMYFGTAPSDTVVPTMNGSITSSAITTTSFTLSWPAASDNVAVTGYEVSIDGGGTYGNVGNVLTTNKTGLTGSTSYPVRVRAYDAANNKATPLSATVNTGASSDSTAPNMQGSLTVSLLTESGFTVGWIAASDNVAVVGYEFSTDNGSTYSNIGSVLSYAKTGLSPLTLYNVKVRAYDGAGNRSTPLSTTATTLAAGTVPSNAVCNYLRKVLKASKFKITRFR